MNHFTKLKSRESFSLRWLLLSLLLLVNVGVWAEEDVIDFEQDLTGYSGWTFANITKANVVTPYKGDFYANTSGKATASITTNAKIASPAQISFFLSKESSNINPSSFWKVEVSADATVWQTVGDSQSAVSMSKGEWIEVSRDLSGYNDVYVRISYRGTTAVRCIDDITLTYESASGPSISATDVTYEADATKGEIPYTINNGDGSTLSASSETAWISNVTVDAEKVTFDMAKNTEAAPREGVVTLTYGSVTKDVTVTQKAPVIKYNITWSVNGVTTTEQVEQGQPITFDNAPEGIPADYVFTGWYGDEYFNATDAPAYVSSATATADVTYYAVFAKKSGEGTQTTIELTNDQIKAASDADKSDRGYKEREIDGWKGKYSLPLSKTIYSLLINRNTSATASAHNSHVETPECAEPVKSITINTTNNTVAGRIIYLCSSNTVGAANADDATYGSGTLEEQNGSVTIPVKGETTKLYIYSSATLYIQSIQLTYGEGATYSDFRTSLADVPATATITLSEKCTDGEMYYGTYSSTKPFVVSDDIIVSEISVIDNQLNVEEYASGAVVPANTGVMVSSMTYGNHEVALSEENGQSVLGEENMLRPTGDAGITAAEMAAKDAACKYYRLTMHKGETLGYFYGAAEGAAFNIAAGKAYLAVPEALASKVLGFAIGGGVTGIGAVADNGNAAGQRTVYNLHGQRVNGKLAKGVYIVNGKKVIIK